MGWDLTILAAVALAYAVVSRRLSGGVFTPAIVFVVSGFILGSNVLDVFEVQPGAHAVRLLAEITLTLVLFSDASAVSTRSLRHEANLPVRLLGIGLPLTILLGTVVALPLFPSLGVFEAVVLAVLLAPTDAALGQTVVSDTRLPSRLRQGLVVESGLNDGICVPLLFAAISFAELEEQPTLRGDVLVELARGLGVGIGVGLLVGAVVSLLVRASRQRGWMDEEWAQLVPLAAAVMAYTATDELGGSGFIGAFVAGLLHGRIVGRHAAHHSTRLTEELGGLFSGVAFFVFGGAMIGATVTELDLRTVVFAVLSLTLLRMVPVALALLGSSTSWPTALFAGWFGPRGLATIVFALILIEESTLPHTGLVVQVAVVTVALSVLAHGMSASWLTDRYVAWLGRRTGTPGPHEQPPEPGAPATSPPRKGAWHRAHGRPS